jgi:hypothetical protein
VTDFLDRFDDQLRAAQLAHAAANAPASRTLRTRLRAMRHGRRVALIMMALLVTAVPALAIVAPWKPSLYRPGLDQPVSTASSTTVPAASWLAVLRRDQTDQDRSDAAPLLPALAAGNQVQGVQTDSIRTLNKHWALAPVTSLSAPGHATAPGLCLVNDDGASACDWYENRIRNAGIMTESAGSTGTELAGVVPDGVAKVRFTPVGEAPIVVDVTSNFYDIHVAETSKSPAAAAPPADSPPPEPVNGRIEWLDSSSKVIGPTLP